MSTQPKPLTDRAAIEAALCHAETVIYHGRPSKALIEVAAILSRASTVNPRPRRTA